MDGNGAQAVLTGFSRHNETPACSPAQEHDYDRGSEMACHPETARPA